VPQARIKETDRIHVMCEQLKKMGADITELEDGLVIRESRLKGCKLEGYGDHRVVMSLAIAGLNAEGETVIDTAEAVNVTFPDFVNFLSRCGADIFSTPRSAALAAFISPLLTLYTLLSSLLSAMLRPLEVLCKTDVQPLYTLCCAFICFVVYEQEVCGFA